MKDRKRFWYICQDLTVVSGAIDVRVGENVVAWTPVWLGIVARDSWGIRQSQPDMCQFMN